MLIEFSVTNFRSIQARQTLTMVASSDKAHIQHNVAPTKEKGLLLLRSAVIYGPNAAGKSNILRALHTLQQMVLKSATAYQVGQLIPVTPFLLTKASTEQPTTFDIIFTGDDGVRYHYVCEAGPKRIFKEWLVAYPNGRPQRWFERSYDPKTDKENWWFGPKFVSNQAERKIWQEFTGANVLFLSNAIKLNNEQLRPAYSWLAHKLVFFMPDDKINLVLGLELLREDSGNEQIMRFMRAADIGIDRLEVREEDLAPIPPHGNIGVHFGFGLPVVGLAGPLKRVRVLAWHKRTDDEVDVPLDLNEESDGTHKLFAFIGPLLSVLELGATLIVDELDSSLHPHITRLLVGLFHSRSNEKNAQLVFTTHNTTFMDTELLRRDQIWFVEKDAKRSTQLYSLLEYSPRKDEALGRGYLKGRYGAIPFVGRFEV